MTVSPCNVRVTSQGNNANNTSLTNKLAPEALHTSHFKWFQVLKNGVEANGCAELACTVT